MLYKFLNVFSFLITSQLFHCVQTQVILHTCCQVIPGVENDSDNECFNFETKIITTDKTDSNANPRLPKYLPMEEKIDTVTEMEFRLVPTVPECSKGDFTLAIPLPKALDETSNSTIVFKSLGKPFIIDEVPVQLYSNGYLRHGGDNYSPHEFCITRYTTTTMHLLVCNATCGPKNPCVKKCCDVDQVWDLSEYPDGPIQCKPSGEQLWNPVIYSDPHTKVIDPDVRPHIVTSHPRIWCVANDPVLVSWRKLEGDKKKTFKILQDGNAWYKYDRRKWINFTEGFYCVDGAMNFAGTNISASFTGFENDSIVFDCGPELKESQISRTSELYGICMIFACCFLLVTVIVYILLWEKHNVHGWTLLCYFSSLFFMYLFLSGVHFSSMTMEQSEFGGNSACHIIAVMAHLFFLMSFCWMTTINVDIWWKFRALKPTDNRSRGIKRFLVYLAFSVGVPLIIVGVALTLDFIYGNDEDSEIIVPDYGKKWCYMERKYAPLPYLYGPAGVLLTCNLFFFTLTIYAMYKIQQSTKFATTSSSKSNYQKQSALLFGKLFIVMGIPWCLEVVSWATTPETLEVPWYWVIFDLINIFQAIAIFIIFVFKKETFVSLEGKYPSFRRFLSAVTIKPETAETMLERRPRLRLLINMFTRSPSNQRNFSSRKTQSTVTEASRSRSRRSSRSHLEIEDKDKFGIELVVDNEPRGVLP